MRYPILKEIIVLNYFNFSRKQPNITILLKQHVLAKDRINLIHLNATF